MGQDTKQVQPELIDEEATLDSVFELLQVSELHLSRATVSHEKAKEKIEAAQQKARQAS